MIVRIGGQWYITGPSRIENGNLQITGRRQLLVITFNTWEAVNGEHS